MTQETETKTKKPKRQKLGWVRYNVNLTQNQWQLLTLECETTGVTMSEIIRQAMSMRLEKK